MNDELSLQVVIRADLEANRIYGQWSDPEQLAQMHPAKRAALLTNPLSTSPEDPVQIIGLAGPRVVGRIDLLQGEINVRQEKVEVIWGSALFVSPAFRTSGMGLMLMLKMQNLGPVPAACGISQAVYPIYEKLRWTHFRMPRQILLRRSRAVVEKFLGDRAVTQPVARAADAALSVLSVLRAAVARVQTRGLRVRQLQAMPSEFDERLHDESRPATPHRSARWINWLMHNRFDDFTDLRRGLFIVMDRRDTPVGYFLTRSRFYASVTQRAFKNIRLASLQEWAVFNPERVSALDLALLAIREMSRWGVDAIEICTPDERMASQLRRLGLAPAGALDLVFKARAKTPLALKEFQDQTQWRIRPAEGDNFQS